MKNLKWIIGIVLSMVFLGIALKSHAELTNPLPTIELEAQVHFLIPDGSVLMLDVGEYVVEPSQNWIRITPSGGQAVDAHLLEAQVGRHEEKLTNPLALSVTGVEADSHHLVLLLPDGQSFAAHGTYSGIQSRGGSRINIQRIIALAKKKKKTQRTEFVTPSIGGSGGNRSYNLDCGTSAVLVGSIYKAGLWLDALGIICQRVNARTGALEDDFTRGPVGGGGGLAKIARCGQGRVVQGMSANSGQYINRILMRCSEWEPSRKAPIFGRICNPNSPSCTAFGGRMAAPGSDLFLCPQGKVGKAFRGRHGAYIDSMKFACDFWNK